MNGETNVITNSEMTFDEFMGNPKNQAEFDRRTNKALDTARKTWEEEYSKKQAEIEATAKLSAEERAKKQLADITRERDELKSNIAKVQMENKARDYIKAKGYNQMLADLVDLTSFDDEDTMMKKLDDINGKLSNAINKGINTRTQERGYRTQQTVNNKKQEPGFNFNFNKIK